MIITNFNEWVGYQFGNKLLGINNLIQISNFYKQDYFFNLFNGLEIFDIENYSKKYDGEKYEILDINQIIKNKDNIILDNNKIYYLEPCLLEFFHDFSDMSTFEIFKFKNNIVNNNKIKVGVHFRGKDFYLWDPNAILPTEYYIESIQFVIKEISTDFVIKIYTDDLNLKSYKDTIEWLNHNQIKYKLGDTNNHLEDFKDLSNCDYIISSPSTFCITASLCGNQNKKIIHSEKFVYGYKFNSDYFRDVFWKNLYNNMENKNYKIYKLI